VCTTPDIGVGTTSQLVVRVLVGAGVTGPLDVSATASSGAEDPDPSDNTGSVRLTVQQQTTTTTSDTYRVTGTITATGARVITEVGAFDASTVGNLVIYGDFAAINLATNDSIAFTINTVLDQA
jgi:hypothetical protein